MKFADVNQKKEVLDFLEQFATEMKGFLLLSGKNGTGKSFAALSVYYTATHFRLPYYDHDQAIFTTQTDLNLKWSKQQATTGETVSLLEQICMTRLLVLDDIGTRIPSEAFMDFLYGIADKRYSERDCKATIITTNLSSSSMREKFGDAFVSRVASGQCFRFEGKDRRFTEF